MIDKRDLLSKAGIDFENDGNNIVIFDLPKDICVFNNCNKCSTSVQSLNIKPGDACPWAPNEWERAKLECSSYKSKIYNMD